MSSGVRAWHAEEGVTVYMTLVAACAAALHFHTGQGRPSSRQSDGIPRAARARESVIGPFVNLLALRIDISDDPTFVDLLALLRMSVLDAHEHRDVRSRNWSSASARALTRPRPLISRHCSAQPQMRVRRFASISGGAVFDVMWVVRDHDGKLQGTRFRADRYSERLPALQPCFEAISPLL